MRYHSFGRRKLDRMVHFLIITALCVDFAFVLVSGYFLGKFVMLVNALETQVRIARSFSKELRSIRDRCQESMRSLQYKPKSEKL